MRWPGSTPGAAASRPPPPTASSPMRSRPRWWRKSRSRRCAKSSIAWCVLAWAVSEPAMTAPATPALDVERLRQDFPILAQRVRGKPLVYLDNAATTPEAARGHRRGHPLLRLRKRQHPPRGALPERARLGRLRRGSRAGGRGSSTPPRRARSCLPAAPPRQSTSWPQSWGRSALRPGDEILITGMEHHSNIVPWHLVAEQTGAIVRAVPITDSGELDLDAFDRLLGDRTRLLALVHLSNALGTINPVRELVGARARAGRASLVDGAQSAPHLPVDVQAIGLRLLCLLGPQDLWTDRRRRALRPRRAARAMPPWQGGGDMIASRHAGAHHLGRRCRPSSRRGRR